MITLKQNVEKTETYALNDETKRRFVHLTNAHLPCFDLWFSLYFYPENPDTRII